MTEKRRLEIVAALNDQASGPMRRIGKEIKVAFGAGVTAVNAFRKVLGSTQTLITAVLGGALLRKGAAEFNDLTETLQKVNLQAQATNTTAESLNLLRNAAAENAVNFDQLAAAVRTFEKNIGDARQGARTQNETLRRLGLTTDQFVGTNKDAVEQLAVVADGLSTIEDASIRSNLALKLFGEDTGAALLPILSQGGAALREYARAQREAGQAISDKQIQQAADYQRELTRLQNVFRTLAEGAAVQIVPAFVQLFTDLRKILQENGPFIQDAIRSIVTAFSVAFGVIIRIGGLLRQSFLGLQEGAALASLAWSKLRGDVEGAAASLRELEDLDKQVQQTGKLAEQLSQAFFDLDKTLEDLNAREFPTFDPFGGTDPAQAIGDVSTGFDRFWSGFSENARRARDRWTDFRQAGLDAANTIVDGGLTRLSDTFAAIATRTGRMSQVWKEFARAVLGDLAKIAARVATTSIVSSLFSSSAGGGSDIPANETGGTYQGSIRQTVPLRRFERGGVVRRPTLALFGEGKASKGEAFVPLPDGRRIPVALAGAGGGANIVNFTIQAWDGRDATRALYEQRGTLRAMFQSDLSRIQAVRKNVRSVVS